MSNPLKKITNRAKEIYRKHPSMKWTNAIKQASRELKGNTGSKSGSQRKPKPKRRKSSPVKRAKVSTSHTYVNPETLSIASIKAAGRKILNDQLGKKLAKKSLATRKTDKKKYGKEAAAIRAQLMKFQ